ncbi:OsmC family protein [Luteococcus sp. Sow4_B9]|uniref:OsmC family protein n=1 Tax=Luteococcus sp. Sow4_B9 TaxID=3438792 RepID=UPI003F99EC04
MADTTFTATAHAPETLVTTVTARGMSITIDEPPMLGGTDQGMNPVEALLGALGACKCIVARSFARKNRINLHDIRVECSGVLDPDGFMGKNPEAKIGFSRIHSVFHIDADNTDEEIAAFIDFIESHCPVQDTLANPAVSSHEVAPRS